MTRRTAFIRTLRTFVTKFTQYGLIFRNVRNLLRKENYTLERRPRLFFINYMGHYTVHIITKLKLVLRT